MSEMSDKIRERVEKWLESLDETEKAVEEPKTTEDIIDDLMPMMNMSKDVVVGWLISHDYHITTVADGSPRWAIWRFVDTSVLT